MVQRSFLYEQVYKPGSVLNGHLSWSIVTDGIMRSGLERDEQPLRVPKDLASGGVYIAPFVTKGTVGSYPTFPPLP